LLQIIRGVTLAIAAVTASVAGPQTLSLARPVTERPTPVATPTPVGVTIGQVAGSDQGDRSWAVQLQATSQAIQAEQQRKQALAAARKRATQPQPVPSASPNGSPSTDAIRQIISDAFAPYGDAGQRWGLRVARCESGFNPRAYNPAGPYVGLFQFQLSTFLAYSERAGYGYSEGDIWDPTANSRVAAFMYGAGKEDAWGCN
jgi:soluble lytic murein transglycosylase-like protein